jgi:hypothetical protein
MYDVKEEDKNPQHDFLWRRSKAVGHMSKDFTACEKSLRIINKYYSKTKLIISFAKFLLTFY